MLTKKGLIEATGYTDGQIKHRRERHWREGRHYIVDPAGAIVYDLEEIQRWQQASPRETASALSDTTQGENVLAGRWTSHTQERGSQELLE